MVDLGEPHAPRLRVMTWNLHGAARPDLAAAAALIADEGPHVVLLQEVRRGQAAELADLLGDLEWRWLFKHSPFGRLGRRWAEGLAVISQFPIRAMAGATLARDESPRSYRRRVMLEVVVATAVGPVRLVDVHLASDDEHDRAGQADRAVRLLSEPTAGVGFDRTVLAGDLNTIDADDVIGTFVRAGLREAWTADVAGVTKGATNPADAPVQRIDHVLVGDQIEVESMHVVTDRVAALSDHLPVVADLVLPAASAR